MKKLNFLIAGFILALSTVEGADATKPEAPKGAAQITTQEKYEILKKDQIDSTDTLAIPFDDSEVEDEEEVNRIEGKKVFNLPQAPKK